MSKEHIIHVTATHSPQVNHLICKWCEMRMPECTISMKALAIQYASWIKTSSDFHDILQQVSSKIAAVKSFVS